MELNQAANAVVDTSATEAVAEPQTTVTEPTTPTTAEPTVETQSDLTQTQAFAKRLKEATEKARQAAIEETETKYKGKLNTLAKYAYGDQVQGFDDLSPQVEDFEYQLRYGQGVSREAIEKAVADKLANHPELQAAKAFNKAQMIERDARLLAEKVPELGVKDGATLTAYVDANPDVTELVEAGWSPNRAIWAAKGEEILAKRTEKARLDGQQEAISKLQANAVATPGPVGAGAEAPLTLTDAELARPDQAKLAKDPAYFNAFKEARLRKK